MGDAAKLAYRVPGRPPEAPRPSLGGRLRWLALLIWRSCAGLVKREGLELSGYMAFTALLALFPFLIFLAALAGFLGDQESATRVVASAIRFVPHEVASALAPVIHEVVSQHRGGLLTFGIVFALWTASSGVEALRVLLNRSYGVQETRSVWWLRTQSLAVVVVGAGLSLVASILIVLGPVLWWLISRLGAAALIDRGIWVSLRYGLAALIGTAAMIALHLLLPNCRHRVREVWPGAATTTVLWLAAAALFSFYVENFAQYSIVYGSLGGIILSLLFFYVSGLIVVFGAELNAHLRGYRCADRPDGYVFDHRGARAHPLGGSPADEARPGSSGGGIGPLRGGTGRAARR
jgi:membrane protein